MKTILQRVSSASVVINNECYAKISQGILVYVCVEAQDTHNTFQWIIHKITNIRVFNNAEGKFHYSVEDIQGALLFVPNFTLAAQARKGNRPSFSNNITYEEAEEKFNHFTNYLNQYFTALKEAKGIEVKYGKFGADMTIHAEGQGPVNIILNT